jgi:hypothetical protein
VFGECHLRHLLLSYSRIAFPTMTVAHDQPWSSRNEIVGTTKRSIATNAIRMVAKERLSSLRGRAPPPGHILGDTGLADLDAELEEFAMDSRRSPQRVGDAHLADQPANFQ